MVKKHYMEKVRNQGGRKKVSEREKKRERGNSKIELMLYIFKSMTSVWLIWLII